MLRKRRAGLVVSAAIGAAVLAGPAAANATTFTVTSNSDTAGSCTAPDSNDAANCDTLRDAINAANVNSADDTITLSSLSGQTITLSNNLPQIDASDGALAITGTDAHDVTIDGGGEFQIFNVAGSNPVNISGLTLTGGYVDNADGGALYSGKNTDVTISNTVFTGNTADGGSSPSGPFHPDADGGNGGAIGAIGQLAVSNSTFENNDANWAGGAIFTRQGVTLRNSTLSGNTAGSRGGAIAGAKYDCADTGCSPPERFFHSDLDIAGSTLSDNNAYVGGAIDAPALLSLSGSSVTGNTAHILGGGIDSFGKYAQTQISDSRIASNTSHGGGGGISVAQLSAANPFEIKYSGNVVTTKHAVNSEISRTTIAGNHADYVGGGVGMMALGDGDHFTITHSTISGNEAAPENGTGFGGGVYFASYVPSMNNTRGSTVINALYGGLTDGEFRTEDSTISGNSADVGGGVSVGGRQQEPVLTDLLSKTRFAGQVGGRSPSNSDQPIIGPNGSIDFENSTIASNSAKQFGGGLYTNQYADDPEAESPNLVSPTIQLTSSIVADNQANGAANDTERPDGSTGGGIDSAFSLVENPTNVPFIASQSSLTGIDPQLGALGDNGGPTQTQLPSTTSPVIDRGKAPARLLDDQRGLARIVDGDAANAAGGDGADIGADEVQNPAKNVVVPSGPQTVPDVSDHTPPRMTLKVPKELSIAQLIRGFNVKVNCNEPCSMTFRLYASAPTGTLHSAGYNFRLLNKKIGRKSGSRKVHLQPCLAGSPSKRRTHVCRKRITAALFAKPQQTFKVKLIVAAKDKAANVSHRKAFIRIHH